MQIDRKDLGYSIYSRLEGALRLWLKEKLIGTHGEEWASNLPQGIIERICSEFDMPPLRDEESLALLLDETHLSELKEIACYKNGYPTFAAGCELNQSRFQVMMDKTYDIR